ncbi:hypothetical protein QAD02_004248 [Eretmocerus hayati]|uniref:Uncharacterized protein n=1 Tax=Eretmocerus hayati TaxID=131215 RepID=A0ACC2NRW5_9HYME|nr:hypothetical protein QAD02_004248 [Eretmocerus hayati]
MPMPAEYHESIKHENYALGGLQDNSNMTANMYRVGDYVYFETSSTSPYQIRRIEELNKTASGNVEAKVMCFFRRRDLPSTLVMLADKHQLATAAEQQRSDSPASAGHCKLLADSGPEGNLANKDSLNAGTATKVPMNRQTPAGGGNKVPWLKTAQGEGHEPHERDMTFEDITVTRRKRLSPIQICHFDEEQGKPMMMKGYPDLPVVRFLKIYSSSSGKKTLCNLGECRE